MEKKYGVRVIDLSNKKSKEAAKNITQIIEEIKAEKDKRVKLVDEMSLITMEFHRGIIAISKRFDLPAKHLMFDGAHALLDILRTWDDKCEEFTEDDAADLEKLRMQVHESRKTQGAQ